MGLEKMFTFLLDVMTKTWSSKFHIFTQMNKKETDLKTFEQY